MKNMVGHIAFHAARRAARHHRSGGSSSSAKKNTEQVAITIRAQHVFVLVGFLVGFALVCAVGAGILAAAIVGIFMAGFLASTTTTKGQNK
jgi:cell division protein FtsX